MVNRSQLARRCAGVFLATELCFSPRVSELLTAPPHPLELPGVPTPAIGDRASFGELTFAAYLAHSAISPLPLAGQHAVENLLLSQARGGTACFPVWMAQRKRLRASLAEFLGVVEDDVALTPGCTRGITDVALALPWKRGEALLTFEGEFPANVTPWQQAASLAEGKVEMLPLPSPEEEDARERIVASVERAFREPARRVAFLALSAVQFQTGLRMPLEELGPLCERHGVRFLVDGIQGCGVMPFDLPGLRIDAFFGGAHKWMLGLEGAGFLVTGRALFEELQPRTAGWLSHQDGELFLFKGKGHLRYDRPLLAHPRVFEGSTANAAGLVALEAGLDLLRALGPSAIAEHVQRYHDALEPRLVALGFRSLRAKDVQLRSGIVSYRPPDGVDVTSLFARLSSRGVRISIPDGLVRIAPHFANPLDEVEIVADAFQAALRED